MKFFRFLGIILSFIVLCGWSGAAPQSTDSGASVYFMPHQDDEMFMGGAIAKDVQDGKRVYVVLVTDGSASVVRYYISRVKNRVFKGWEDYNYRMLYQRWRYYEPISTKEFSLARNGEFLQSVQTLGVPDTNIFFGNSNDPDVTSSLIKDGSLKKEQAKQLVEEIEKKVGVGTFNTLFPDDGNQHPDHHALGLGLEEANILSKKRYFFEHPVNGFVLPIEPSGRLAKLRALMSYFVWSPAQGRFAVGAHSVENRLLFWRRYPYEFAIEK